MPSQASLNGNSILSYVRGLCNGFFKFEILPLIWEKIDDVKSENGNRRTNTQSVFKNERKDIELIKKIRINVNDDANYKPQDQRKNNLQRALSSFSVKFILSFVTITLITTASCHDINVTWVMKSNRIFFGKTAELECVISDSVNFCNRTLRQWYGGIPYVFLCRDGACRNQDKYGEQQDAVCKYTLTIYNFSENDVNCDYTCTYGVYSSRKMLKLDNNHFSYLPAENDTSYIIEAAEMLNVTVLIQKSFPKPLCKASFAGNMIISTSTTASIGYLYQTEIRIVHTPPVYICQGLLEIICMIGSSQLPLVNQTVTICKGLSEKPYTRISFFLISTLLVFPLITCVITCSMIMKLKQSRYRELKQVQMSQLSCRYTPTTDTDVRTAL